MIRCFCEGILEASFHQLIALRRIDHDLHRAVFIRFCDLGCGKDRTVAFSRCKNRSAGPDGIIAFDLYGVL